MKEKPSFFQFDNQAFMNMNSLIGRSFIVLSLSMSSWLGFAQEVVMMNVHQGHSVAAFESGAVDSVTFTADAHDYDKRMGELMMQHPYPITTDSLRILILGNSFSYDSTCYLQAIVDSTGIDQGRLGIYNFFIPASNFQTWIDKYESGETINVYNTVGGQRELRQAIGSGIWYQQYRFGWCRHPKRTQLFAVERHLSSPRQMAHHAWGRAVCGSLHRV